MCCHRGHGGHGQLCGSSSVAGRPVCWPPGRHFIHVRSSRFLTGRKYSYLKEWGLVSHFEGRNFRSLFSAIFWACSLEAAGQALNKIVAAG